MRLFALSVALILGLFSAQSINAASIYAGQARAATVCSQCHGIKTPSADAPFPPLAGRDFAYLKAALEQYRDKTRKSDIMNAIAGSLTDNDISNVAAYYSGLKL
jgi:cytochrome c553